MPSSDQSEPTDHVNLVSVVIPVYKGEKTLPALLAEIAPLTEVVSTPGGRSWRVTETILVFDNGPDGSDATIRALAQRYDWVRPVWLSRNFGQHSATLAGMASSGSEWISTIDEDGQHDPLSIGVLIDTAIEQRAPLVYARPTNEAPHGFLRNLASRGAKATVSALAGDRAVIDYQSFRLVLGEVGRSVAAYAGAGVYLDVALGWVASRTALADVALRDESGRTSGYSLRSLFSHFWRLILTSGTRALRLVSAVGALLALAGVVLAIVFIAQRVSDDTQPQGWASLITVMLISSGAVLFSLGVIAEYLGVAVKFAMGKPLYLVVSDPDQGPLGQHQHSK